MGTRRMFKMNLSFFYYIEHCNQHVIKKLSIVSSSLLFNLNALKVDVHLGGKYMKLFTKSIILVASLVSMGALTACQSTTAATEKSPEKRMMDKHHGGEYRGHHHGKRDHMKRMNPEKMTAEQRAKWDQRQVERKARFEQIQKACEGKTTGQTVQLKIGEKTIDGSCEMKFKPTKMERTAVPATAPTTAPVKAS